MARILYVEDDLNLSYVTKDSLELAHHSVCHCTDGKEAINKIEEESHKAGLTDEIQKFLDDNKPKETKPKEEEKVEK